MARKNRPQRREQAPPVVPYLSDPLPTCPQCTVKVLVEVDQFTGGLWQNVVHEHGCPEYAALQRQQARKAVNHGH